MSRYSKATLGGVALPERTGFVGNEGAVSAVDYTTAIAPSLFQHHCPRLVVWLRCRACHRGDVLASSPSPQPSPACAGGRQHSAGLWELRSEAAPAGVLAHTVAQEGLP